jgi:hypothetical protein
MSTNGDPPFRVVRCNSCGSAAVEAIGEHGLAQCRVCLAEADGWRAGQEDGVEEMVAAVISQALRHLSGEQLQRIVDSCLETQPPPSGAGARARLAHAFGER